MDNHEQYKSFFTVEQVADLLQIHWQTVLNYIKSGKLNALKLGKGYRIPQESIIEFVNENMVNQEPHA